MRFLTGRQSKLARLLEKLISEQRQIEIEMANGVILYGTLEAYELSPNHLILTVQASSTHIINFQYVVSLRTAKQQKQQNGLVKSEGVG